MKNIEKMKKKVLLPNEDEIIELASKYSSKNATCSFNFYGSCNVNPDFRNDIIKLIEKYINENE